MTALEKERRSKWTMASNFIFDEAIPELTKKSSLAALLMFLVERKTAGYHRLNARISTSEMMSWTHSSESQVKRARRVLLDSGYVEVVEQGTGLKATKYRVVLDREGRRAAKKRAQEAQQRADKIIELPQNPARQSRPDSRQKPPPSSRKRFLADRDVQSPDPQRASQPPDTTSDKSSDTDADREAEAPITTPPEAPTTTPPQDETTPTQTPPASTAESTPETSRKPNKIKGVHIRPPLDIYGNIYTLGNEVTKTNKDDEQREKQERKQATASVCRRLKLLGFEPEPGDYAFIGWCVKVFGAAAVEQKVKIMKFQTGRGVKFSNPFGWLRVALTRNFQYSRWDSEVMKAKERAKRASERSRLETERQRRERAEILKNRDPAVAEHWGRKFLELVGEDD